MITRAFGILSMFALAALFLTSPAPVPDDAFVMPPAIAEARPDPLPHTLPLHYAEWIIRYTDETGVPVWMACRLFAQESTGNPMSGNWNERAVSWLGAQGLAQLMPVNLGLFSERYNGGRPIDPFDAETAIRIGLHYLADLYALTGSWRLAVMSYNGGAGHWMNPRKYGDWQPETVSYVKAVLGS